MIIKKKKQNIDKKQEKPQVFEEKIIEGQTATLEETPLPVEEVVESSKVVEEESSVVVEEESSEVVEEELKKGEKIQLVGFGTFEVSERAARTGRNPQTGAEMKIEASKAPKFKAGKALKDSIN